MGEQSRIEMMPGADYFVGTCQLCGHVREGSRSVGYTPGLIGGLTATRFACLECQDNFEYPV